MDYIKWTAPTVVVTKLNQYLVTLEKPGEFGEIEQEIMGWFGTFDEAMDKALSYVKEHDCALFYAGGED